MTWREEASAEQIAKEKSRVRDNELKLMDNENRRGFTVTNIDGDMGEDLYMEITIGMDGDVSLSWWDYSLVPPKQMGIEFCTIGGGGGKHPIIYYHLATLAKDLKEAIERGMISREDQREFIEEKMEEEKGEVVE